MSNESAPEILTHKDNRNIQVRLDYILLYHSEVKAKLVRILETWTNTKYAEWYKGVADSKDQKSNPPEENLWVTMSYDQFSLFVFGTIQRDTIKQQVDELVALKHIKRRPHPEFPYGAPQYLLNRKLIQEELNNLEIPTNLYDLSGLLVSPRKKRTPQEKYPQGRGINQGRDPGKIPPAGGEVSYPSNNISKNTKNHSKNEGTYDSAIATSSPALSNLPSVQYLEEIEATREVVGEKIIELDERRAALSEQDSYSPVTLAGGYEKKEDEDGSTDVSACRAGSTGGLPDSAPVSNQRSTQRTGRTEKAEQTELAPSEGKKRTRKPTAPKVDANEVEMYLDVFDELYCEVTGDPELGYDRTGVSRDAVTNLLKNNLTKPRFVTPDKLRAVYRSLFKKPKDEQTGFCWADNMSIKAVCRNYASEAMALTVQAQQKQQKTATPPAAKKPSLTEDLRAKEAYYNAKRGVAL